MRRDHPLKLWLSIQPQRISWNWLGWICGLALVVSACRGDPVLTEAPPAPVATSSPESLQVATFEALWSAVDENYIYGPEIAETWQGLYAPTLGQVRTSRPEAFPEVIRATLERLPEGAALWQSREDRINQDREAQDYEGIGAYVAYRADPFPRILLLAIVPGSPAEAAGLAAHESIVAVEGLPILAEEGLQAVERIRGAAGTQVNLTIMAPGGATREVAVTRNRLVASGTLQGGSIVGQDIGYFLFPPSTYETMGQDFVANLQIITEGGTRSLDGLILDLRVARTSAGWPLDILLALFADGDLGALVTRAGQETMAVEGRDFLESQSIPLVILVGRDTQGAPEIFAAILQASGRATVIGLPTPGLVEQSQAFPLPDGSQLFVAVNTFQTPDRVDVGRNGVVPSLQIEADWDEVTPRQDPVLQAAIDLILE